MLAWIKCSHLMIQSLFDCSDTFSCSSSSMSKYVLTLLCITKGFMPYKSLIWRSNFVSTDALLPFSQRWWSFVIIIACCNIGLLAESNRGCPVGSLACAYTNFTHLDSSNFAANIYIYIYIYIYHLC